MKTLRLLLFEACNRKCPGCCNKDWNLGGLPVASSFKGYKEIILTGGEPMLRPHLIKQVADRIREDTTAKIYVYTAKVDDIKEALSVLESVDGLTVTLHEPADLEPFRRFDAARKARGIEGKSLRLNIFFNVETIQPEGWKVKAGIEWIKDCPLPSNEVFMRFAPKAVLTYAPKPALIEA